MSNSYPQAPLIPGDSTLSNGFITNNLEVFGNFAVDGSMTIVGSQIVNSLYIASTTDSTNSSTGALVVAGGVGIGLDVFIGGSIGGGLEILATTASTSIGTGALIVSGGAGIATNLWVGGNFHATAGNPSYNSTGGTGQIVGGLGVTQSISLGVGIQVREGSNAKQGTSTLIHGSILVATNAVGTSSRVFLTTQSAPWPTAVGTLYVSALNPGNSFLVSSTNQFDPSTFAYEIFDAITS